MILIPDPPVSEALPGIPLPPPGAPSATEEPDLPAEVTDTPNVVDWSPEPASPPGPPPPSAAPTPRFDDPDTDLSDIRLLRRRRKRQRFVRRLKVGAIAGAVGLTLLLPLSCLLGWPFAGMQKLLPQALRKPDTLEEIVDRLKERRVVIYARYLHPGQETEGKPGYVLGVELPGPTLSRPCYLLEFETERDVDLFMRLISIGDGRSNTPQQADTLKKFQSNKLPGFFRYGRFLFSCEDPRATDKIREALP